MGETKERNTVIERKVIEGLNIFFEDDDDRRVVFCEDLVEKDVYVDFRSHGDEWRSEFIKYVVRTIESGNAEIDYEHERTITLRLPGGRTISCKVRVAHSLFPDTEADSVFLVM